MPTLYVENIPSELYEALRKRARDNGNSISSEVTSLLAENIPTAETLARRKRFIDTVTAMRARKPASSGRFQSAEEMLRKDRLR